MLEAQNHNGNAKTQVENKICGKTTMKWGQSAEKLCKRIELWTM